MLIFDFPARVHNASASLGPTATAGILGNESLYAIAPVCGSLDVDSVNDLIITHYEALDVTPDDLSRRVLGESLGASDEDETGT